MTKKKMVERRVTTDEFAVIAKCTVKTVRRHCREIYNGSQKTLDNLSEAWGLVGVERASNKWLPTVRPVPPKK